MKFKVQVDLEELLNEIFEDYDPDYGPEVDLDIKSAVKLDILHKVKKEVISQVKEPLITEMSDRVKILIKDAFSDSISDEAKQFIQKGKLQGRYKGDEEKTVSEYIDENFKNFFHNGDMRKITESKAKEISDELKNRYDMIFASNLIVKLNEQGLLKEGVYDTIISKKKNKNEH